MNRKPNIFISAEPRELESVRDLVADKLDVIGCRANWVASSVLSGANPLEQIQAGVDSADGVIQLIGHAYGSEPQEPHEVFGRISHTQFEALYARQRRKMVWFIVLDDAFPCDPYEAEPAEKRQLQDSYRELVRAKSHLGLRAAGPVELKKVILGLEDDIAGLHRRVPRWTVAAVALLTGIFIWLAWPRYSNRQAKKQVAQTEAKAAAVAVRQHKIEQALVRLPNVEVGSRTSGETLSPQQLRARADAKLEDEFGIRPGGSLADELTASAEAIRTGADSTPLQKARAAYALYRFDEAEAYFSRVNTVTRGTDDFAKRQRIAALEGAGAAAVAQLQFGRALNHYRAAAALIDEKREPIDWERLQHSIDDVIDNDEMYTATERFYETITAKLHSEGFFPEAAQLLRNIIKNRQRDLGSEHRATLAARNNLAVVLQSQNEYAQAEKEFRYILKIQTRTLGLDHPESLISRGNLAIAFSTQGKHAAAEAEYRAILDFRTRTLGPDHPATLACRNTIAASLAAQGRYSDAETENRAVLRLQERVMDRHHPDILATRNNLAEALRAQGKNPQAEAEHRAVLEVRERLLGAEHPDTLASRSNLALVLRAESKNEAAESEHRAVLAIRERLLGMNHPDTLASRNNLAAALAAQGKLTEAETQHRATLSGMEKTFGPEYPDVFLSSANVAMCLEAQGKNADALPFARRALAGWRKTLGEEHPYTVRARTLVQELVAK